MEIIATIKSIVSFFLLISILIHKYIKNMKSKFNESKTKSLTDPKPKPPKGKVK